MLMRHKAWLSWRPHRTEEWLREKLREGFDVHHLDGNYQNDDPLNLVLIEHTDHLRLHNGSPKIILGRLGTVTKRRTKKKRKVNAVKEYERIKAQLAEECQQEK